MFVRSLILLLALGVTPLATAETAVYAIVVGNNAPPPGDAGAGFSPLRYADDDAVRYLQLFERFTRQTIFLSLLDAQTQRRYPSMAARSAPPTLTELSGAFKRVAASMAEAAAAGDEPVLYLAYSGHGFVDDEGRAQLALLDRGLTRELLFDQLLEGTPASYVHLIVDACYAGAVVGARGMFDREVSAAQVPVYPEDLPALLGAATAERFPGLGFLLASSVDQEAHEWSGFESGVFTHEVLSGLHGPADINGDRLVEYSELQAFVTAANREISDPRALPTVVARPPARNRNAPLVDLRDLERSSVLAQVPADLGHFHVELANGQRLLDAHLGPGSRARFALPLGHRAFVRTQQREAVVDLRAGERVELGDLPFAARQSEPRGARDHAFRSALFSSPYTETYYKGFVDSTGAVGVRFTPAEAPGLEEDHAPPLTRFAGVGLVGLGAAGLLAGGITGALTWMAYQDFDATPYQRAAFEANQRVVIFGNATWASAAVAAVALTSGALLLLTEGE